MDQFFAAVGHQLPVSPRSSLVRQFTTPLGLLCLYRDYKLEVGKKQSFGFAPPTLTIIREVEYALGPSLRSNSSQDETDVFGPHTEELHN